MKQKNVLGTDLEICNENPMTGFFEMVVVIQTKWMLEAIQYVRNCHKRIFRIF